MKKLLTQEGFTLVELMIVVAIIGVLSAIAIPNYQKFTARSKQAEAKTIMADMRTALSGYQAASGSYTLCLANAGFNPPTGAGSHRNYAVAVGAAAASTTCGPGGNIACSTYGWDVTAAGVACTPIAAVVAAPGSSNIGPNSYGATDTSGATLAAVSTGIPAAQALSGTTFTIGASGSILNATLDTWTMTNAGAMTHVADGVQ